MRLGWHLAMGAAALAMTAAMPFDAASAGGKRGGHQLSAVHGVQGARWGHRIGGRWHAGVHAPGGWYAYRRPSIGYVLPRYWINPAYYIGNVGWYGLSVPPAGYGWSRYYDDAVLTDRYGRVHDSRSGIDWAAHEGGYDDTYGDRLYDRDVLVRGDDVYAPPARGPATSHSGSYPDGGRYDGAWQGSYGGPDGRSYTGAWSGTVATPDGRVYDGDWQGSYTGSGRLTDARGRTREWGGNPHWADRAGADYPTYDQQPYSPHHAQGGGYPGGAYQGDYDAYVRERCRRETGLGGAAIGGVVGGVAGNVIAGSGNRLAGTLIGAGAGALAGAAIDKAEDRARLEECERLLRQGGRPGAGYAYPQGAYAPGYGYGYGYAPGQTSVVQAGGAQVITAPGVTTVVVQGAPQVTTTTTTVVEEYYAAAPRPAYRPKVRKAKPRPKPRCVC